MRSLQDEIRRAQRELICPICARKFDVRDINLRLMSGNTVAELSVSCSRGHFPVVVFAPVTVAKTTAMKMKALDEDELRVIEKRISNLVDMAQLFK